VHPSPFPNFPQPRPTHSPPPVQGYPIGIPFNVVNSSTRYVELTSADFNYGDESDLGLYPLPDTVNFEAPGDHHAIFVDSDSCKLCVLVP
jgi:hypothetical protein